MTGGTTIGELRWPKTPDFMEVARKWRADASGVLSAIIWRAYDVLIAEVISKIDITMADDQLERSITQYLALRIDRVMSGDEPFEVLHGPYEYATAVSKKAQPPMYDIAFCLLENERVMWPMEAKVIRADDSVRAYVSDVKDQFLKGRYAPFSSEGCMLAYMLAGDVAIFFANVETALPATLTTFAGSPGQSQRFSFHKRTLEGPAETDFTCHHFGMAMK